jgi:L,D-transpeptidase YcbB
MGVSMKKNATLWCGSCFLFLFLAVFAAASQVRAQIWISPDDIQSALADLSQNPAKQIQGYRVAVPGFVAKIYESRGYRPAWRRLQSVLALKDAISDATADGLKIEDFHPGLLGLMPDEQKSLTPAQEDILLTDALVRLLYQLHYGKVNPESLDSSWNYGRPPPASTAVERISSAIDEAKIAMLTDIARPDGPSYQLLRQALADYRRLAAGGGWVTVDDGPAIKPAMTDPRVVEVRRRLEVTGELAAVATEAPDLYDEPVVEAVKAFQQRHGIDVDGVLGPGTIAAMNVSVQERVQQIRVNLERARWILTALKGEQDLVLVNVAGFYLLTLLDGKAAWWTEVITGTPYHKTPMFTDEITYVEFNPTWTIPPGILRKEILPKLKQDAGYLDRKGYDLFDASGNKVNARAVNWSAIGPGSFPYRVVQPPGPENALGLVKFMFPNKHNVYLHDTPGRTLFSKTGRAFSHGCVRVRDPMKFAEVLLGNRNDTTRDEIDSIVQSKKLTRVKLKAPIPVALLYWTADPLWGDGIRFYRDVYGRDARILKALDEHFKPTTF